MKFLSLSEKYVPKPKKENYEDANEKFPKFRKFLKIQFILYFVIGFIFLGLFWYYISCFCAVYKNTQIYLIKDTLISFGLSFLYPFIISLIAGLVRIPALNKPSIIYKFSKFLQLI